MLNTAELFDSSETKAFLNTTQLFNALFLDISMFFNYYDVAQYHNPNHNEWAVTS